MIVTWEKNAKIERIKTRSRQIKVLSTINEIKPLTNTNQKIRPQTNCLAENEKEQNHSRRASMALKDN